MDCRLTDAEIDARLDMLERMIAAATPKELPGLNATFQRLLDVQVARDLARDKENRR